MNLQEKINHLERVMPTLVLDSRTKSYILQMIQTIEQQQEEIERLRNHLINLSGDGVERMDYIKWLQFELSRVTDQEFKDIEGVLNKSNYLDKPYKFVNKKELYNSLAVAVNEIERLKGKDIAKEHLELAKFIYKLSKEDTYNVCESPEVMADVIQEFYNESKN